MNFGIHFYNWVTSSTDKTKHSEQAILKAESQISQHLATSWAMKNERNIINITFLMWKSFQSPGLAIVGRYSFVGTILSPSLFCCMSNCGALTAIAGFLAMNTDAVASNAIVFHRWYEHRICHIQLGDYLPSTKCSIFLLLPN